MQENNEDWREDLSDTPIPVLKVRDGENKTFVFLNEGEKKSHPDFGESIVFSVEYVVNEKPTKHGLYIKSNNFDLLRQIKLLGKLAGLKVNLSRTGSKRSDTRYKIVKVD